MKNEIQLLEKLTGKQVILKEDLYEGSDPAGDFIEDLQNVSDSRSLEMYFKQFCDNVTYLPDEDKSRIKEAIKDRLEVIYYSYSARIDGLL